MAPRAHVRIVTFSSFVCCQNPSVVSLWRALVSSGVMPRTDEYVSGLRATRAPRVKRSLMPLSLVLSANALTALSSWGGESFSNGLSIYTRAVTSLLPSSLEVSD